MRAIPYAVYLLLIALHVVILHDVTAIYGAVVSLPALLVLAVALYKDEIPATWFGFAAGLVAAAGMPSVGWHVLVMAALALVASHIKLRLNLDALKARMLLIATGVLVHNCITLLINQPEGFLTMLWTSALTSTAYTLVLAWLFFLNRQGTLTWQKVKSIF